MPHLHHLQPPALEAAEYHPTPWGISAPKFLCSPKWAAAEPRMEHCSLWQCTRTPKSSSTFSAPLPSAQGPSHGFPLTLHPGVSQGHPQPRLPWCTKCILVTNPGTPSAALGGSAASRDGFTPAAPSPTQDLLSQGDKAENGERKSEKTTGLGEGEQKLCTQAKQSKTRN